MSTPNFKVLLQVFLSVLALGFLGCNGNGIGSSGPTGTFNLSISDTPVDGATSVLITFTGVEVQPGSGGDQQDQTSGSGDDQGDDDNTPAPGAGTQSGASGTDDDQEGNDNSGSSKPLEFNFSSPMTIDLLKQQGGNSASLLNGVSLPAGHYEWIRLKLATTNCCTITLTDGSVHPLTVPSGDESGLKLVHGFTVAAGGAVNFTIDFDLRRSVVLENGQYHLKPVLRITDNEDTGHIHGVVANTLSIGSTAITNPACKPAAYVYAGDNVTPVDINPVSTIQPATTATVALNNDTGNYEYNAGFLASGDYTVALTCAANDNPATVDNLTFTATKNATVTADMTTEVDFP